MMRELTNKSTSVIDSRSTSNVISFNGFWTSAGRTERQACLSAETLDWPSNTYYFGFPWFSLFHALETKSSHLSSRLFILLIELAQQIPANARVVSMSQHPRSLKYFEYFKHARLSLLFYPHKTKELDQVDGIRLSPFPLAPLQFPPSTFKPTSGFKRKYLANFIGTEGADDYHSETRKYLFTLKSRVDLRIVERPSWFYENVMRRELELSLVGGDDKLIEELEFAKQFVNAMRNSTFAFCPAGRGLCSSRVYESIAFGAIPIVLAPELDLPGDKKLWHAAAIIDSDDSIGVNRALKHALRLTSEEVRAMRQNGKILLQSLSPNRFIRLFIGAIENFNEKSNI